MARMRAGKRQGGWEQIVESDEAGGLRDQVRKFWFVPTAMESTRQANLHVEPSF